MEMLDNDLEVLELSAKQNSIDNILLLEEMKKKTDDLFKRQQNNARIAQDIGVRYQALNNTFVMKAEMEELGKRLEKLDELVNDAGTNDEEIKKLSDIVLQVSTLMNYLNNPKSRVQGIKLDRFNEMILVEENELKRQIWDRVIKLKTGAELRVLDADEEDIDYSTLWEKFIGLFTHKRKMDELKREQIDFKRKEVQKVFNEKWGMEKSYSIHEIIAMIKMFLRDNWDDYDLLEDEINGIQQIENGLRRNFVIKDERVSKIIDDKEKKLLPVDASKISKEEQIEIEAYRFLSRNGYDKFVTIKPEESEYVDTMANEIKRITDYIDASL